MKLNLTRPLIVFDLETTGLDFIRDRIIQISYIKVSPDGTEERENIFVNPEKPIPREVVEPTGINDDDVKAVAKEAARIQFAQYGMTNIPEEYIEKYANDMIKDEKYVDNLVERAIDSKLAESLKKVVKLNEKTVSLDDFNKMMQEK